MADLTIAVNGASVPVHLAPAPEAVLDAASLAALSGKVSTAALAAGTGAAMVGLDAGGNVQDAVKYVTPLMFGAVGDGVADDTVPIDTALATGKTVWFPDVYSFLTQGLHQVTTDNQRIIVDGLIQYDGVRRQIAGSGPEDPEAVFGFQGLFQVQDHVDGVEELAFDLLRTPNGGTQGRFMAGVIPVLGKV